MQGGTCESRFRFFLYHLAAFSGPTRNFFRTYPDKCPGLLDKVCQRVVFIPTVVVSSCFYSQLRFVLGHCL